MTLVLTWAIALFVIALCGAFRGESAFDSPVLILVGAALASLPIALAVELIGLAYFGRALSLPGYVWQLLYTLPLSAAFGLLAYLVVQPPGIENDAAHSANDGRLIDRLPPEKRGPVLYLTMHDHYVQVVTSKGSELVLLRFSDALQELGERDGLQIHRSHWVALDAVAGCRRDGDKMLLTMSDGTELPVSRTYRKAVRELGLEASEASDAG